jgi:hypothetical protein
MVSHPEERISPSDDSDLSIADDEEARHGVLEVRNRPDVNCPVQGRSSS